jgi:two-component system LytT family response regulator
MIRCIIVDDEQHAIDILVNYVGQCSFLQLEETFTNPIEALKKIGETKIDLVFLDVQMPELSGMDFIYTLNGKCKVILTTAYNEFALKGYDLDVVDYLVKPIRLPRFLQAVQKAVSRIAEQKNETADQTEDHFFVKTGTKGKLLRINFHEIDYVEGMKNYVSFSLGKKKILVHTGMKEIEDKLPKQQFIRVHKSYIVSTQKIIGIEGNSVLLKEVEARIIIGESYKAELMAIIHNRTIR